MGLEEGAEMLKRGGVLVVYDGDEREGEADIMFHAGSVTPEMVEMLRKEAGGLICLAIGGDIAKRMELPFYTDILAGSSYWIKRMECAKTAYNDKPAFAIPINHKDVYTGITDNDRALTIRKMAMLAEQDGNLKERLVSDFYSPGHVFLLIGRGIGNRKGHTELSLELARRAGLSGMMVLCEMLGKGKALPKDEARRYAEQKGFIFLEGSEIYG